ncbi:basic salivary proline-rich protein 2-like [Ochotona princeps]|uniref:basic salivary proline-rich protein 2-like n=1 Tax=Ochotona princeps TaxID=9978 RepID=UPI0027144B6F|nr:basic salivary proline-rich protein 2-like [Ochotona princeps]
MGTGTGTASSLHEGPYEGPAKRKKRQQGVPPQRCYRGKATAPQNPSDCGDPPQPVTQASATPPQLSTPHSTHEAPRTPPRTATGAGEQKANEPRRGSSRERQTCRAGPVENTEGRGKCPQRREHPSPAPPGTPLGSHGHRVPAFPREDSAPPVPPGVPRGSCPLAVGAPDTLTSSSKRARVRTPRGGSQEVTLLREAVLPGRRASVEDSRRGRKPLRGIHMGWSRAPGALQGFPIVRSCLAGTPLGRWGCRGLAARGRRSPGRRGAPRGAVWVLAGAAQCAPRWEPPLRGSSGRSGALPVGGVAPQTLAGFLGYLLEPVSLGVITPVGGVVRGSESSLGKTRVSRGPMGTAANAESWPREPALPSGRGQRCRGPFGCGLPLRVPEGRPDSRAGLEYVLVCTSLSL